jgi:hypothetical protein
MEREMERGERERERERGGIKITVPKFVIRMQ